MIKNPHKFFYKTIVAAAVCLSAVLTQLTGCFLFNGKLDTPNIEQIGSIYSWTEVEGANKYMLSTGGKDIYTDETTVRIINPDKGGTLTVTAVKKVGGEIKAKSEGAVIECKAIGEDDVKYREYDITDDKNVSIASSVSKAVIKGDGEKHSSYITVEKRDTPLIVELYDVHCYNFKLQEGSVTRKESCVTVRSLGNKGNAIYGVEGAAGTDWDKGGGIMGAGHDGGDGSNGGDAASFGYVIFEGDKPLSFYGGDGGRGGKGGDAGTLNSVGGDGGNGGNGGCGLSVEHAYVYLDGAELDCNGGYGGNGGFGGQGKFVIGLGYDNGEQGKPGLRGEDFKGEKIVTDYLTVALQPDGASGDGNGETSVKLTGVYKFYSVNKDGTFLYVGDSDEEGNVLTEDCLTLTFGDDGVCELVLNGDHRTCTWEAGGKLLLITTDVDTTINGRIINDGEITINSGNSVITLKKSD